ncbi:MAG: LamG-like jellyroll fold domain-containing protein, partial [Bacteroidota bacterium]
MCLLLGVSVTSKAEALEETFFDSNESTLRFSVSGTGTLQATALNFDGSDDVISFPSNPLPTGNDAFTLEAWVKPVIARRGGIIGWGNYGSNGEVNAFRMATPGEGSGIVHYSWGSATDLEVSEAEIDAVLGGSFSFYDGDWHHVAVSYDGSTKKAYVDGTFIKELPNITLAVSSTTNLSIGSTNGGEYFEGDLDEVRVWSTARTCAEILAYKNVELLGTESDLVAYYNFNQGLVGEENTTETTLNDLTANNNDGTLLSFSLTGTSSNWIDGTSNSVSETTPTTFPEIQLTATTTNFGFLLPAESTTLTYQITNTGSSTLTISEIVSSNTSTFVTQSLSVTLAAGASVTFEVTFSPSATSTNSATITIFSNDCNMPMLEFGVSGMLTEDATALDFDGVDDYVTIPHNAIFNDSPTGITLETWVKMVGITGSFQNVVDKKGGFGAAVGWNLRIRSNGVPEFFVSDGNGSVKATAATVLDSEWHHIACVLDYENDEIRIYVDGILENTKVQTGNVDNTLDISVGRFNTG